MYEHKLIKFSEKRAKHKGQHVSNSGKGIKAEVIFGGIHNGEYPGAFPPNVEKIIRRVVGADRPVLHLFSGSSTIGDVRVDINLDSKATHKMDVFEFLKSEDAQRPWRWVIGDPDYSDEQVRRLGRSGFSSQQFADWRVERIISAFMTRWAQNIIWLDRRMPNFSKIFTRKKVWLVYPGGWHNVRVLQWLTVKSRRLREVFM